MKNIYLIGFMGSGKSTIASQMQKRFHLRRIEMDDCIVKKAGMPISQIFATQGEPAFRRMETALLKKISYHSDYVVSCGGGVVLKAENVRLMKRSGKVVLLVASPEVILERVSRNNRRPVLEGKKNLKDITEMMEARRPAYEAAADLTIEIDGKTPEEIADELYLRVMTEDGK